MSSVGSSAAAPAAGFTLLEFLVVLAIIGLVLAIVPANLVRGTGAQALKADARQLTGALQYARTWAISRNDRIALVIEPGTKRIIVDDRPVGSLSQTTEIVGGRLDSWRSGSPIVVEFQPDGGSSGADILLSYKGAHYRLNVNWLTGAVALSQE